MKVHKTLLVLLSFIGLLACEEAPKELVFQDIEKEMQEKFILAEDGDVLAFPAGNFKFTRSLALENKKNIRIKGAGMGKTLLSFQNQQEGAEGIKINNGTNIIIEDMTILDAKGDGIKAMGVDTLVFRNVKAAWSGKPKASNGAYGFYPVQCKNILIENCEVTGSSDAGIYVGQSDYAIIRKCKAYQNVAGIETENSNHVDVYENEVYDNTGGVLVFNLPGLSQQGSNVRVFNNTIQNNNHDNFATEGNIVASIPPGVGLIVLATQHIEVFDNQFIDNQTVGTAIISYVFLDAATGGAKEATVSDATQSRDSTGVGSQANFNLAFKQDTSYNAYPSSIYLHENTYKNSEFSPSMSNDMGLLIIREFGIEAPDIIWDGIVNPDLADEKGKLKTRSSNLPAQQYSDLWQFGRFP